MTMMIREYPQGVGSVLAPLLLAMTKYHRQRPVHDQVAAASFAAHVLTGVRDGMYHAHVAEIAGEIVGFLVWRFVRTPTKNFVEVQLPAVLEPHHFTVVAGPLLKTVEQTALVHYRHQSLWEFVLTAEGDDVLILWFQERGYGADQQVRQAMAGLHKLTMTKRVTDN